MGAIKKIRNEDKMEYMKRFSVGVDLGGTQLRAGVVNVDTGALLGPIAARPSALGTARNQGGTAFQREKEAVLTGIADVVREAVSLAGVQDSSLLGVGVAVPDPVLVDGRLAKGCTTMIGWDSENIRQLVAAHLARGVPGLQRSLVWAGNDVNAHALGELRYGAGRGIAKPDFVYFAIGTGIGAGLILDGKLRVGFTGCAGEWGHIVVDPSGPTCLGCGRQKGCLEMMAGGIGIGYHAQEAINSGRAPALGQFVDEHGPADGSGLISTISSFRTKSGHYVDAHLVIDLAKVDRPTSPLTAARDEARDLVKRAGEAFGKGLVQVMHSVNPSHIVVGGSIISAGDLYLDPARDWVEEHALPAAREGIQILISQIREEAAILGAAGAVQDPAVEAS